MLDIIESAFTDEAVVDVIYTVLHNNVLYCIEDTDELDNDKVLTLIVEPISVEYVFIKLVYNVLTIILLILLDIDDNVDTMIVLPINVEHIPLDINDDDTNRLLPFNEEYIHVDANIADTVNVLPDNEEYTNIVPRNELVIHDEMNDWEIENVLPTRVENEIVDVNIDDMLSVVTFKDDTVIDEILSWGDICVLIKHEEPNILDPNEVEHTKLLV